MLQKFCTSFDGTELYYLMNKVEIEPLEPFLVFIHGAGSNHTVYKPFFAAFENHNFIAIDLRNHGKSGKSPIEQLTIANIVNDICKVLEQEKISSVILVGNSLGATVAINIAKCAKKKVEKMILFTLFSKRYILCSAFLKTCVALLYQITKPFSRRRKLQFTEYHKYPKRPIWYYPYLDVRGTSITTILKCIKELFTTPLYVSSINIPTQIFICHNDWSTKNSLIKSDCRGNKYIETVDIKSNHVILTRQWEEVLLHVKKFLV